MKITFNSRLQSSAGYALMITLIFVTIALMGFGSIMCWMSSSTLVTERNNLYVSAQAAAESATEKVMTTMMRDFTYGSLNPVSSYDAIVPDITGWPSQFTFKNTSGAANQTSVSIGSDSWTELPSQFRGLYGHGQDCVIASTATTAGKRYDVSSTVSQSVWFGNIPLFQFAIFYNLDMEINPGASMTVNGRVHSNYNIWATGSSSGSPLNFSDEVEASGLVVNAPSSLDPQNYGNRSGNVNYADTNSPVSNADSLTLPIGGSTDNDPVNVKAILNLPPSDLSAPLPAAYSTNGQVYLYNEADLIVSNSPSGINGASSTNFLMVLYQNQNQVNPLTVVAPDVQSVQTVSSNAYVASLAYVTNMIPVTTYTTNIVYYTSGKKRGTIKGTTVTSQTSYTPVVTTHTVTNVVASFVSITNRYYSFVTNQTFYDYREGKTVQAVQVDVGQLNAWLANNSATGGKQYQQLNTTGSTDKNHGINSIYVFNSAGEDSSTLPAVRVTDGAQLPSSGLTVATPMPIYVKGDYNVTTDGSHYSKGLGDTTYTVPAALLGDALTILSANWSDSYNSSTLLSSRNPSSIYINAATLEGIVPSDGTYYSGGVENFMRLLENWSSSTTITYNGSIVVMFPSQYATSPWGKSNVYGVPTRRWGFDNNFSEEGGLPPMTPQVKATVRGNYATK